MSLKNSYFDMDKRRRHNSIFILSGYGFTLVEAVIAIALFSVVAVSAYGSFRSGFVAYQRIESQLGKDYEIQMLVDQLSRELSNTIQNADFPFEGEADRIIFPCRLGRYDGKKMMEDLYRVSYQFRSKKLERTEEKLRKGFRDNEVLKEPLLRFEVLRFQYAYKKEGGEIEWKNEWSRKPYAGIPRAIRLVVREEGSKRLSERTIHFLIPHGILVKIR